MQTQGHPLEPFFQKAVRDSYEGKLGLNDPEIIDYVARLLCDFSEAENLYKVRDEQGKPVLDLEEMLQAADPVGGTAASFDEERAVRKHIGDYTLFVAGMYPGAMDRNYRRRKPHPSLAELIRTGKESYYIVSQFNLFEYQSYAPLFARLSQRFEQYVLGLALVREEMGGEPGVLPPQ